jgi:hypothetical protein
VNHENVRTMAVIFVTGLTDEELENLAYHVERGTTICCGPFWATYFYDGKGGA